MNFFTKLFNSFFEYLNKSYILLHPEHLPSELSYKNLFKNISWFYKKKTINFCFKLYIKNFYKIISRYLEIDLFSDCNYFLHF